MAAPPIDNEMGPPPSSPPRRGWHGMKARDQRKYIKDDWRVWGQLGDAAVLVDVVVGSPAWKSGIHSGTWILTIAGMVFDLFEQHSQQVGAIVSVKAWRPNLAHFAREIILVERPRPAKPRKAMPAAASCGDPVAKKDRAKWQTELGDCRELRPADKAVAQRLVNKYARGSCAFPAVKRLAYDLNVSKRTIERAIIRLAHAGFIRVASGRKAGRVNNYTLTWPAPVVTNVTRLRP
jgi:hypothetical protein